MTPKLWLDTLSNAEKTVLVQNGKNNYRLCYNRFSNLLRFVIC